MGDINHTSLINNFCQCKKIKPQINLTETNSGTKKFYKCQITLPGYDYTAQGGAINKKSSQEKASDEMVQYLQVVGDMDDHGLAICSNIAPKVEPTQQLAGVKRTHEQMTRGPGGYTMENARSALNLFLQKNRQPTDIQITSEGSDNAKSFIAQMRVFVPRFRQTLYGKEKARNKKSAQNQLSFNLVQQLFKIGAIPEFQVSSKRAAKIEPTSVNISAEMGDRLSGLLRQVGIEPVQVRTDTDEPQPLLLPDIESQPHREDCEGEDSGTVIAWSPPTLRYDPWLNRTIDLNEAGPMWNEEYLNRAMLDEYNTKCRDDTYKSRQEERQKLPMLRFVDQVLDLVTNNSCVLIRGGTGCGKTTQVPQFLLDHFVKMERGTECNIVITQPRRISAVTIAERVAWERHEELRESVGYSVRFDSQLPRAYGSMVYCTTGTLLRRLSNGVHCISHIIVDEIHERDVNTDFLLIILRDMMRAHPDLKIILMSATVDVDLFVNYFKCPVIEVPERTFNVDKYYLEDVIEMLDFTPPPPRKKKPGRSGRDRKNPLAGDEEYLADSDEELENSKAKEPDINCNEIIDRQHYKPSTAQAMAKVSEREFSFELVEAILDWILQQPDKGAVLIFLPGWNHIFALQKYLKDHPTYGSQAFWLLPLHSQIPKDEQKRVFVPAPEGFTKIILSTNIAETSVTINDCVYVIDLCKAKIKEFYIKRNLADYRLVWASKTNLEQRAGRAGRVRPGVCFHLCSRARYELMPHHISPEIQRTALHTLALTIKALNMGDVETFLANALEAPPKAAVAKAVTVLHEMGALTARGDITPMGNCLAQLPLEPRLAQTIILSCLFRCGDPMITMAAASCFREPWIQQDTRRMSWLHKNLAGKRHSDHVAMLNAFMGWEKVVEEGNEEGEQRYCDQNMLSSMTLQMIGSAKQQLKSIVFKMGFPEECLAPMEIRVEGRDRNLDMMIAMLAAGLYPNVCVHHEKRKLWVSESQQALMHKSSVNCTSGRYVFPSPYFAFGEKIKTKVIAAKSTTMVSPLHLLLFGSSSVISHGDIVMIDEWIPLKMPGPSASLICGVRKAMEQLLMRCAVSPDIAAYPQGLDQDILEAVYALSDPRAGKFAVEEGGFEGRAPPRDNGAFVSRGGGGYEGRTRGGYNESNRGGGLPARPNTTGGGGLPSRPGEYNRPGEHRGGPRRGYSNRGTPGMRGGFGRGGGGGGFGRGGY